MLISVNWKYAILSANTKDNVERFVCITQRFTVSARMRVRSPVAWLCQKTARTFCMSCCRLSSSCSNSSKAYELCVRNGLRKKRRRRRRQRATNGCCSDTQIVHTIIYAFGTGAHNHHKPNNYFSLVCFQQPQQPSSCEFHAYTHPCAYRSDSGWDWSQDVAHNLSRSFVWYVSALCHFSQVTKNLSQYLSLSLSILIHTYARMHTKRSRCSLYGSFVLFIVVVVVCQRSYLTNFIRKYFLRTFKPFLYSKPDRRVCI